MPAERKTARVNARLPAALTARLDFVVNNTETPGVTNRSSAIERAITEWLPNEEQKLKTLGLTPPEKGR